MKTLLFLLATIFVASQGFLFPTSSLLKSEWKAFKVQHKKRYSNRIEDTLRMKIYLENRRRIAVHNKSGKNFTLAMNQFGDMLLREFSSRMNGYRPDLRNKTLHALNAATFIAPANVRVPDSIDWRDEGAVTGVKNQGHCGSCWAFSSTGSLEGQNFRLTGELVSLSEQNLIDCSGDYNNDGCNGGKMNNAFTYIKDNDGIDTENSYPYKAQNDECRYSAGNKGAGDKGFVDIPSGDEDALKTAVATVGPISVAIDASHPSFQHYSQGIYYEVDCSSDVDKVDHGVLVVGYGTENGQDYWIVKNSWGEGWGERGYIRMSRNQDNNCGIASEASYPLASRANVPKVVN